MAQSRKVAFCVLAVCAVLACVGAVYFWYLWFLTAKTCIDTYILKTAQSIIIHPELADSWQSKLIGLDISSFSALTLALLFTRLGYVGSRNTIRYFRRDGWAYFGRAYHSVLFTEGFETLCVRFGLLGTLLSFLLAAVSQLSSASVTPGERAADVLQESVRHEHKRWRRATPGLPRMRTRILQPRMNCRRRSFSYSVRVWCPRLSEPVSPTW